MSWIIAFLLGFFSAPREIKYAIDVPTVTITAASSTALNILAIVGACGMIIGVVGGILFFVLIIVEGIRT